MGNDTSCSTYARNLAELEDALKHGKTESAEKSRHGWSKEKHPDNIFLSEDGLVAKRGPDKRLIEAVRGSVGYNTGIHAFRFSWKLHVKRHLCIGIVSPHTKLSGNGMVLGSDDQSVGWDLISKEIIFNGIPDKSYPERKDIEVPDNILMILNMDDGVLAFQSPTQDFGVAFRGLKRMGSTFHVAAALGAPGDEVKLEYIGSIVSDGVKTEEKKSPESLVFNSRCGSNILLTNKNKKAERRSPLEVACNATALTNRPLMVGELFQVRVDRIIRGKWNACFKVGATTNNPESMTFAEDMESCHVGVTWTFSGNKIRRNGKYLDELNGDLNYTKVGETAGVKLEKHKLEFYMNGYRQTSVPLDTTDPVFGYVDVYGNTPTVSVFECKMGDDEEVENMIRKSRWTHDMPETVSEYLEVMETGLAMMKTKSIEYISEIYQLVKCLNKVQLKALTNKQRQQAADTLADRNGAEIIAEYMVILNRNLRVHDDALPCYRLLRDLCFNYSEHSFLLCKKIAKTSTFTTCISDMVKYKDIYQGNESAGRLLKTGLGILQNCAKVPENKPMYIQHHYMDIAKDYIIPEKNPTWACMQTLFTMAHVHDKSEIHLLVSPTKVLETLSKCLKNGLKDDHSHEYGGWTVHELVVAITNLTVNDNNITAFIEHGIVEHLVTMLEVGNAYEKECALNAIWNLITDQSKVRLAQVKHLQDFLDDLIEDMNVDVNQAAIRVKVKLQTGNMLMSNGLPHSSTVCPPCQYMKTCVRFLDTLQLSEFFFDKQYDVCYCAVCHGQREGKLKYIRGNPPKGYGVPVGWCRFGLSPPPKAKALDVFSNWHRAYHGTKKDYIKGILEVGELVPAGRDVMGGVKVKEQDGHFDDFRKPFGFDTKKVFLSPSIRYSSVSAYAKPSRFFDPVQNRCYTAKVVLQVLIKPESYSVGPETIGARGELDPSFSNQELEWSTKQQGSTVLYGLLINLV